MKNIRIQTSPKGKGYDIVIANQMVAVTALEAVILLRTLKDMEKELVEEIEGCEDDQRKQPAKS